MTERNIVEEFYKTRKGQRPYLIPRGGSQLLLNQFHINPRDEFEKLGFNYSDGDNPIVQTHSIQRGKMDKMVSSFSDYYFIASDNDPGIKLMPDRLIIEMDSEKGIKYWLDFYRRLRNQQVTFSGFKNGEYGVVGFNPRFGEKVDKKICVKFFNLAFPFTDQEWQDYLKDPKLEHERRDKKWKLSAVTGAGNYVAFRYLAEAGFPVPNVFLGTSELLVQEYIPGYTLGELTDQYEVLKEAGIINDDMFGAMWDWNLDVLPGIANKVKDVIEPLRPQYWSPDFRSYDITGDNIIFREDKLEDFANNYVIIDPFR